MSAEPLVGTTVQRTADLMADQMVAASAVMLVVATVAMLVGATVKSKVAGWVETLAGWRADDSDDVMAATLVDKMAVKRVVEKAVWSVVRWDWWVDWSVETLDQTRAVRTAVQ